MIFDDKKKEGTIKLRDGREYKVSITYKHWDALEWITEDTGQPMYQIIDAVEEHLPQFQAEGYDFDYVLEAYIEHYCDSWQNGPRDTNVGHA